MRIIRRRRELGQATVELALLGPLLVLILVLAADLGRGFYLSTQINGAARQGMLVGIADEANDIGAAVRDEPNSAVVDNSTNWGNTFAGGANANCGAIVATCGDPNGCPPGSLKAADNAQPSVFTSGRIACFAIRRCTVNETNSPGGICPSWDVWQTRPANGSDTQLQVLVVYELQPMTPLVSRFFASSCLNNTNRCLYMQQTAVGLIQK